MAAPVVKVYGARNLRRTMTRAALDFTELKAANRRAAEIVARAGAARAPKRTGRLAASIRASGTKTLGIVRAGRKSIPYAGPIHWGWPDPPRSDPLNDRRGGTIRPNRYLTEAAAATEPVWVPGYVREMNRIIGKVKGL